jgi:hypothetical protein
MTISYLALVLNTPVNDFFLSMLLLFLSLYLSSTLHSSNNQERDFTFIYFCVRIFLKIGGFMAKKKDLGLYVMSGTKGYFKVGKLTSGIATKKSFKKFNPVTRQHEMMTIKKNDKRISSK